VPKAAPSFSNEKQRKGAHEESHDRINE